MDIFRDYSFGPYFFQVAVMFRNSMFINAILCNSEVWYNLSGANISQLEQVDETLLRRIFETGIHTPKVMLYLELGIYPIRFVIQNRRVMYLHNILSNKQSLQYKVFQAQLKSPCKGDWTSTVKNDLCEPGISLTHQELSRMKKEKFQTFLKEKIRKSAFNYLVTKKDKNKERSKVKDVNYTNLELQPYLLPNGISTNASDSIQLCRFIFSLRCRMLQVRENYKSSYVSLNCELCDLHLDSQKNLLICTKLADGKCLVAASPTYEDLFSSDVEKQIKIGILLREKFGRRAALTRKKS
jgi:hypothetical protein